MTTSVTYSVRQGSDKKALLVGCVISHINLFVMWSKTVRDIILDRWETKLSHYKGENWSVSDIFDVRVGTLSFLTKTI